MLNDWSKMSNPTNKKTHEQFVNEVPVTLGIEITGTYIDTNTKISYKCKHGINSARPWQILKFKHCCREGYYESGKMWSSRTRAIQDWVTLLQPIYGEQYLWSELQKVPKKDMLQVKCKDHGLFEQWTTSLKKGIGCQSCTKEKEKTRKQQQAKENFIDSGAYLTGRSNISKAETEWLDSLNIPIRQKLLQDIKLTVDGYDEQTNTVYLYHGRFWHGCPETYDPEMQHPIIKVKMKDLYHLTKLYEEKIRDAGYNLITKWG